MIEGADWLCEKNFGRALIDKNVEILDPAVGTGTFITELIEHFRGQPAKLRHKYLEELHANEVAILPYYVANLNIEATYAFINGYEEYPNLCFVDTLDNTAALRLHKGRQGDLFGAVSDENVARIKRQNKRTISVIIGNPPYNANQLNENENNKNREYPEIDDRIKSTYIKASKATKTKQYDMFVRFVRWASDRIDENNGIIAFITNRSFIDKFNFDGFRKIVQSEFSEIFVVDLGGDWKMKGVGGGGNVFGIGTGVAISFLIKRRGLSKVVAPIRYCSPPETGAEEKLSWLGSHRLADLRLNQIRPDAFGYWTHAVAASDEETIPIAAKEVMATDISSQARAVFKSFGLGVSTNRDEWLYEFDSRQLAKKVAHLIRRYEAVSAAASDFPVDVKWSETLKRRKHSGRSEPFAQGLIRSVLYRPFVLTNFYRSQLYVDRLGSSDEFFPLGKRNVAICFTDPHGQKPWFANAVDHLVDLHFVGSGAGTVCLGRQRFRGEMAVDNITDWALERFRVRYENASHARGPITKDAIFHYVYGVLHDPLYREKYAQNLKREFPRIPFYADFWRWADWGETLMALHIGYEQVAPWPLERVDAKDEKAAAAGQRPKAILRADHDHGIIRLDSETQLSGVPAQAWTYRLGNRSALEWILDQYKEKTPKDPTIREKFNTYRFADYKEKVIDLLRRVTRVSVETMAMVEAMRVQPR